MIDDPIINEIRKIKENIAAENNYDIHKLFSQLRKMEQQHEDRLKDIPKITEPKFTTEEQ